MARKEFGSSHRGLRTAAEVAVAGAAAGLAGVVGITWRNHRELTHRSIELAPIVRRVMDAEQRSLGIAEPTVWGAVHRIHHSMTDASLYPFFQVGAAIAQADRQGVAVPDVFPHLDPFVDQFGREEVVAIGQAAEGFLRDRLGDEYRHPTFTEARLEQVLHPKRPTYYYPDKYQKKRRPDEFSFDDIALILTTDPHSPALVAPRNGHLNGVRGVGTRGALLYLQNGSDLFYARPDLQPPDLRAEQEASKKHNTKLAVAAGFVVPSAAVLFARRDFSPKGFLKAAAIGSAFNAIRMGSEVVGGMTVNSLGHAGVLSRSRIAEAILRQEYQMHLNEDGSLSTNTIDAGIIGTLLSWATLDEVGRQDYHHQHPEAIAYTGATGLKAWKEAPWGSFTAALARNRRVPFIQEGKGFPELSERPDKPHEGVRLIRQARVRQMEQDKAAASA